MVRTSKVLLSVVTAAALVLGLFAQMMTAFALNNVPWSAKYFTENVEFKAGVPGDTNQFVVQYTNLGQATWVKGAAGQEARLGTGWTFGDAANPSDNTNDFNGGWSSNWLSANRIAGQTESTVLPGTNGTFTWTGKIPTGAASGNHQIKGQPVVDGQQWLENFGYYQGFTVAGAPGGGGAGPKVTSVVTDNGLGRVKVCFDRAMATSGGLSIARPQRLGPLGAARPDGARRPPAPPHRTAPRLTVD